MAAVTVTAQNTRINDMESLTVGQTITSIGGGAGAGLEGTVYYQNSNSIGRKVTDTTTPGSGFEATQTATTDMSTGTGTYQTVLLKYNILTSPDLQSLANGGLYLRVGSANNQYHEYAVEGNDTYPAAGGWQILAVDPNIAGYATSTTGTVVQTAIDYYAIQALFTAGGAKDLNTLLDAIDNGNGLTLTGGDGVDADGVFQDFVDDDEGDLTNGRYGYVTTNDVGIVVLGTLIIGNATATVFTDSDKVIAFADGYFAAGWSGFDIGLSNATTSVDWDGCTFLGKGNTTTTDTRPIITVTGTSGSHSASNCVFDSFAGMTLTSTCTYDTCKVSNSGAMTLAGADISNSSIVSSTVAANASAVIWNVNTDPDTYMDSVDFVMGATSTHAIEFGTNVPATMTLRNCNFSGYGAGNNANDSTFHFKDTTGTITLNIVGGSGNVSYRTDGATINIVQDPVTTSVHASTITGTDVASARVFLESSDGTGPLPYQDSVSISQTGGTATVTHTAHGLATNNYVVIRGAVPEGYNKVAQITVTGVNTYTYSVDSGLAAETGSPVSSGVIVYGLTDVNGDISDSRTLSTDQPVTGWCRKSTSSPFYKSAPLTGTVSSTAGASFTALMVSDE